MFDQDAAPDGARALDPAAEIEKHTRRLPHWEQDEVACYLTFRLADALPSEILARWQHEKDLWMRAHPRPWREAHKTEYDELFVHAVDHWLDRGAGSCVLRDTAIARIVGDAFEYFDGERYTLYDYVVMPNHVHLLYQAYPNVTLEQLLHSWRSYTAHRINRALGRRGRLWQEDYWDTLVRSEAHFRRIRCYIAQNPKAAGLSPGTYLHWTRDEGR